MDLPIYLPNIKKHSTKDLVIRLLTEEDKLTNQQLYLRIKKNFGKSVSYQAVRQALTELRESEVVEKSKRTYSISKKWILTLNNYAQLLHKKYIEKQDIRIIDSNTREIHLHSLNELGHFILYSFKDHFFDQEKQKDLYMHVHHLWFPFIHKEKREMLKQFFSKNRNYVFVSHKSIWDRILSLFYKKYGTVKLGKHCDDFFDTIIQGDCIAKIYMPKALRKEMDKLYQTKNILNIRFIDDFIGLTYAKHNIRILITRNKEMAEEIKQRLRDQL